MKKIKLYFIINIVFLSLIIGCSLANFIKATGDNVCAGSIIKYKGVFFRQDAVYPGGNVEELSITMTTIIFQIDGKINGTLNVGGTIKENTELTNVTIPEDWMMKNPENDSLILPKNIYFISNPSKLSSLKQQLQSIAENNEDWEFSYSGLKWTLRGLGTYDGSSWTYEGVITYDSNTQLQSVEETLTFQIEGYTAVWRYTWTLLEIIPGPTCASQKTGGGSQSNSAAILLGTGAIYYMLGIMVVSLIIWFKTRKIE